MYKIWTTDMKPVICSAAASGWVGWALGVQLTLLQPGGADHSHHIAASPPGFEHPAAALICNNTQRCVFTNMAVMNPPE